MDGENGYPISITIAVMAAIADAKGVHPLELDIVLDDYVDVDVLELLVAQENSSWTFSFELPEHTVTITNEGVILVDGSVEESWGE